MTSKDCVPAIESHASGPDYDVRVFGAKGDGATLNTAALQRTIDVCAANGGGRVVLPAGVYVSGTLYLKSHVTLHLGGGAVLLGSPVLSDYNRDDAYAKTRNIDDIPSFPPLACRESKRPNL